MKMLIALSYYKVVELPFVKMRDIRHSRAGGNLEIKFSNLLHSIHLRPCKRVGTSFVTEKEGEFGVKYMTGQSVYSYVDEKFGSEKTTPFEIEIREKGTNELKCDVGKVERKYLRPSG